MNNYRVVVGYIQLRDKETGELLSGGETFPLTPFNILVDSEEVAKFILEYMEVPYKELILMDRPPVYYDFELN